MKGIRISIGEIAGRLVSLLFLLLFVYTRLSTPLLHTHDLSNDNRMHFQQQCLSCELDATHATTLEPIIEIPSAPFIAVIPAAEEYLAHFLAPISSTDSRGPPVSLINA